MSIEYLSLRTAISKSGMETAEVGDDFMVYNFSSRPVPDYPFKITEYGCFICLNGESVGSFDLQPVHQTPSTMVINVPGQLLEQQSMSRDFRGTGITMSREFVKSLGLPYNFHLDRMLRDVPVFYLQPSQLEAMLTYMRMVRKLLETERPFQMETLRHLTCAFFYGIGSYLYQLSENKSYTNEEMLMQKFLSEIKVHYRNHRKVTFYADRLCLSVSYFSTVIKNVSGKTPGEWIDNYVAGEARALLKGSNLTVQQISHQLGFPSQSFFGKFFKRQVGLSPKEYREK